MLGIRPGGPLGHAKTPEEDGMATFTYAGVIGSEQSLEVWDIYAHFAGILTGSSSLFTFTIVLLSCLYNIVVSDS